MDTMQFTITSPGVSPVDPGHGSHKKTSDQRLTQPQALTTPQSLTLLDASKLGVIVSPTADGPQEEATMELLSMEVLPTFGTKVRLRLIRSEKSVQQEDLDTMMLKHSRVSTVSLFNGCMRANKERLLLLVTAGLVEVERG